MKTVQKSLLIKTKGDTDIINITDEIKRALGESGVSNGTVMLFVEGSTASLTTLEYEPNLVKDLKDAFERLIPSDIEYAHTETWGDYNGHSHIRASIIGPSLQIPFIDKELRLGTWQQVVLIDFDTQPRNRKILIQLMGQ